MTLNYSLLLHFGVESSEQCLSSIQNFCYRSESQNIRILKRSVRQADRVIKVLHENDLLGHCDAGELVTFYLVLNHSKHDKNFELGWSEAKKIIRVSEFPEILHDEQGNRSSAYHAATRLNLPELPYSDFLYDHIESGLLDYKGLIKRINYLVEHASTARDEADSEHWYAVWKIYSNSFGDMDRGLVEAIRLFLNEDSRLLTATGYEKLSDLASTVDMDISDYKQSAYIRTIERVDSSDLFDLRERLKGDDKLLEVVDNRLEYEFQNMNLDDVVRHALENRGWSKVHVERIKAEPTSGIIEWLKTPSDDKVDLVRQALAMDVSGKVRNAIAELAKASPLNAMRARYLYKIQTENTEETES